ncbi:uncharacterized protein LOC129307684 [Prosopis cineraria]|uniref:uncharacterized protein LOC129307684 n=1 Tax=Prosopis cineraria TaxID=364024 RepID=UPI00240EC815|nr:uncharacterized protein LOC129307684 [Prosopis cineraria]
MDSANSTGSLQSSSGGDDEYDSRAESISAFFNHPNPPIHVASTHSNPPSFFDPSSNYLDPIQTSPSLSGFDMMWSKPARSDPNRSDLGGFNPPSSSNQPFFSGQLGGQTTQHPLVPESSSRGLVSVSGGGANDPSGNNNVARNPKKRSRASRRAPTTVLTTDTTNFRAMVQEFTGIPAPPFSSSPFQRSRLDLLGSHATVRSPPPPTYNLLRPFPQKPPSYQPFLSSLPAFPSSPVDQLASSSTNSTTNSNPILYSLSSDLGLLKQPGLNVNTQNPILNFPTIQLGSSSGILASKTQAALGIPATSAGDNSHLKMGVLEEFGLNHVDVNTDMSGLHHHHQQQHHQNMVSSSSDWTERRGTNNGGDHGVMRSASGNLGDSSERDINGKVTNYSPAGSSDFHGEKTTDQCVAARSEESSKGRTDGGATPMHEDP